MILILTLFCIVGGLWVVKCVVEDFKIKKLQKKWREKNDSATIK